MVVPRDVQVVFVVAAVFAFGEQIHPCKASEVAGVLTRRILLFPPACPHFRHPVFGFGSNDLHVGLAGTGDPVLERKHRTALGQRPERAGGRLFGGKSGPCGVITAIGPSPELLG